MTREEIIKIVQSNTEANWKTVNIIEAIESYKQDIRAEVIDECNRKLDELERDYKSCYGVEIIEMYAEVYEDFRTWLKKQK